MKKDGKIKNKEEVYDPDGFKDDLSDVIIKSINSQYKGETVAYYSDTLFESASEVKDWIPTGSTELDFVISNREHGGWPVGRIVELTGMEASGKSLMCLHALKNTQKKGGLAVFVDTENAFNIDFAESIGLDTQKLLYIQLTKIEDCFQTIESIIEKVKTGSKKRLVTIVLDSASATSTEQEMDSDYGKDGWSTAKAIILSKAMRKITNIIGKENVLLIITNQLRVKMGVQFGDSNTTSGGRAIGFHSSVRVRFKQAGQIKADIYGVEQVVGIATIAEIKKNRCGPPLRKAEFDIFFDRGVDDTGSWLKLLKKYKLVKTGGAWYTMDDQDGMEVKFQAKDWNKLLLDEKFKAHVYQTISSVMIIKPQKTSDLSIDDIEIDETITID